MSNPIWQHKQQLPDPENNDPWWSSRPVLIIILAILAVVILTVLWHSLLPDDDVDGEEIPYITAEQKPIKTRPENPGGYQPPHKDKMVYELISNDSKRAAKEKLQPEIEKPMAETKFHNPSELSAKETDEIVTVERTSDGGVNILVDCEDEEETVHKVAPHKHMHGKYHIQVASMDSEDAAQSQWQRLKKKHGPLINKLNADFVKATVKGKEYHRVYVGNFKDKSAAQSICDDIKKAGTDCFVVKR